MFHTSHLSTAHIGCWGLLVLVFRGRFWVLGFVRFLSFRVAPPTNKQSFHPFYDDLGTPPTWRPYSWKNMHLESVESSAHDAVQSREQASFLQHQINPLPLQH